MRLSVILMTCLLLLLVGCGHASQPRDPVGVMRAEIEAINKGQVDVATSYFSDDAQIVTAFGQPKGKEKVKAFVLGSLIKMKLHFETIELASSGTNVTGTAKWTDVAGSGPVMIRGVVQEGKISYWELGTAAK